MLNKIYVDVDGPASLKSQVNEIELSWIYPYGNKSEMIDKLISVLTLVICLYSGSSYAGSRAAPRALLLRSQPFRVSLSRNRLQPFLRQNTRTAAFGPAFGFLRQKYGRSLVRPFEKYIVPQQRELGVIYRDHPRQNQYLQIAKDAGRIKVGVFDTGVDYNHPELAYKLAQNPPTHHQLFWSPELRNNPIVRKLPYDYDFHNPFGQHGTGVAGLIVAGTEDIELLPIRVNKESYEYQDGYRLLESAYRNGVRIFNVSYEDYSSFALRNAARDFKDSLFIIAAGNLGQNIDQTMGYRAATLSREYPNVVTVAALGDSRSPENDSGEPRLWSFSNYGPDSVQIAAPGENIPILKRWGKKGIGSGTSFSAPLVTSTCAKMKKINPNLTPEQLISILEQTVTQSPQLQGRIKWGGALNEQAALKMARDSL